MALELGARLGPYEIVELRGKGGMGEVYRARDTRLDRAVAVKVLPAELSEDAEFKERFEREAKTISRLQHPNVCTLYDIGSEGTTQFLIMEYLKGETLEDRLQKGPLPLGEALRIGGEIAQAVDAAYREGVVHRDLKPGNVMLTRSGAKVLDFGLAKGTSGTESVEEASTMIAITKEGRIVGTMPYMAPEQLQGRKVDHRTDIWALGCILHEMATGERPFQGESQADLIASIMGGEPMVPSRDAPIVPTLLHSIVLRCLEKNPDHRWDSPRDLVLELGLVDPDAGRPEVASGSSVRSIAVLPFSDMSSERDQEYFCDGMADELISALSRIQGLRVVARTSAFRFKGVDIDMRVAGRRLGVDHVLAGSLRKSGNRIRLSSELIDVGTGYQLWSQRYDRELDDVFVIQDEIAEAVVSELEVELASGRQRSPRSQRAPEAYDLLLGAQFNMVRLSPDSLDRAVEQLNRALTLEPEYARAHAQLSHCFSNLGLYGFRPMREMGLKAEAAARRALELDDGDENAQLALGLLHAWFHWNWREADTWHRKTIETNPGYPGGHHGFGANVLAPTGRTSEAVRQLRRACELDPLSAFASRTLGEMLLTDRRYDEAIAQLSKTIEMAPDYPQIYNVLANAYDLIGRHEEAVRQRQIQYSRYGKPDIAQALGLAYDKGGSEGVVRWQIDHALSRHQPERGAWNLAQLYARLGDADETFRWLAEARRRPGLLVAYSKVDVALDSLRDDSRFEEHLLGLGLDDASLSWLKA